MINTRHTEYSNNNRKEPTEYRNKKLQQTKNKKRRYETLQGKAYWRKLCVETGSKQTYGTIMFGRFVLKNDVAKSFSI